MSALSRNARRVNLAAAAWFGSSKVCAIMGGCDTQTLAEHGAHPVCMINPLSKTIRTWELPSQVGKIGRACADLRQ
jgi:hypothetical protein